MTQHTVQSASSAKGIFELRIEPPWHRVEGFKHGLQMPSVALRCRIAVGASLPMELVWQQAETIFPGLIRPPGNEQPQYVAKECAVAELAKLTLAIAKACQMLMGDAFHVAPVSAHTSWLYLPCSRPEATVSLFYAVVKAVNACTAEQDANLAKLLLQRHLRNLSSRYIGAARERDQNRRYLVQAALAQGIPFQVSDRPWLTFGTGCHARRMVSTFTENISPISANMARDKRQTAMVLRENGLPAPQHFTVSTEAELLQRAETLGFPLVIKPAALDQGIGVYADLRDRATLVWAFQEARRHTGDILVERHQPGDVFRFTLYNGEPISVTRKLPGGVVGDGHLSIRSLLATDHSAARALGLDLSDADQRPVVLDDEALNLLAQNGLEPASVPEAGEFVPLRRKTNAAAGGLTLPVALNEVHPDNIKLAAEAACSLRVDVAGVDVIMADVARSWRRGGALVVEVNAQPQVGPQAAEKLLLAHMGPEARVPVDVLVLAAGATEPAVEPGALSRGAHYNTEARATGIFRDGCFVRGPFTNGFAAARSALSDRRTRGLLCVMSEDELHRLGLPAQKVDWLFYLSEDGRCAETSPEVASLRASVSAHIINDWVHLNGLNLVPRALSFDATSACYREA